MGDGRWNELQLNPMKLMQRLERIQEDLPQLKEDCLTLCTEKRVRLGSLD
jgi:hypothetical protein